MRTYLIGFAASFGLVVALAGAPYIADPARSPSEIIWLIMILLVLPTCAAWVTTQTVHTLRPRRLYDPRVHRPELNLLFGAAGGLLGFALCATWRAYFNNQIADTWLVLASTAIASGFTTLLMPRVKRDRCVLCDQQLARLDLCHECGTMALLPSESPSPLQFWLCAFRSALSLTASPHQPAASRSARIPQRESLPVTHR